MTSPPAIIAIVAIVYGCAAFLALQASAAICKTVVPFDDGPRPGTPPSVLLVSGATVLGGVLASQGHSLPALAIFAVLIVSLVACWYSDVRCGIVPDYFTVIPLVLVCAIALVAHSVVPLVAAIVVGLPFAGAAVFSKGRGMGWGDVKLVALGAAVLGIQTSVLAFAAACLAAVVIAAVRRRRSEPIAFVPYLAGSMAFAIAFPVFPS